MALHERASFALFGLLLVLASVACGGRMAASHADTGETAGGAATEPVTTPEPIATPTPEPEPTLALDCDSRANITARWCMNWYECAEGPFVVECFIMGSGKIGCTCDQPTGEHVAFDLAAFDAKSCNQAAASCSFARVE